MPGPGSIYTGTKVRTRPSPLYDSYSVAQGANVNPALVLRLFSTNVEGQSAIGPDTTNMQLAGQLPGGTLFNCYSLRVVFFAAAADIASFCQNNSCRLYAGGIKQLDAPPEYWAGGAGINGSANNGSPDPRAITGFQFDPIQLTDGIVFNVTFNAKATFAAAAAFFMRVYLDGEISEPV